MSEDSEVVRQAAKRIGTFLRGKYRIDRILGVGGMAVVYAATHRNNKRFAVKMLHPELSFRDDFRTRFLREGYVANSVEHPGAVVVLDDDVAEDGSAFLVMELLDGLGVEQLWEKRGNRLSGRVVLALAHQLLDVLAAAHAKTIVHRDIKPANAFLTRDGTLKVLDFGIARLRDATSGQATQTGLLMGTPAFMAPEQAIGRTSHVDGLTDVWAVGATMFSLLSGTIVHVGDNPQMVMIQAATQPARSLASVAGDIPAPVVAVVDRALAFDKAQRWPSAAAMRDAVRDAHVAVFSSALSAAPLVGLFASDNAGRVDTFYADALASTPVAEPVAGTRLSAGPPRVSPPAPHTTATPVLMSYAPAPMPEGRLIGGTTAQPISSDPRAPESVRVPVSPAARVVALATGVVALLGIGGVVVARLGAQKAAEAPAAESSPPSLAVAPKPVAEPPLVPVVASAQSQVPSSQPVAAPAAPASAAIVGKRMPPALATYATPTSSPPPIVKGTPVQSPPPVPAATPTCRAVSYFDPDGNKRFREECR